MSSTLYTAEFVMPTLSDNFYLIRALCDVFAWDFETAYEQIEENRGAIVHYHYYVIDNDISAMRKFMDDMREVGVSVTCTRNDTGASIITKAKKVLKVEEPLASPEESESQQLLKQAAIALINDDEYNAAINILELLQTI